MADAAPVPKSAAKIKANAKKNLGDAVELRKNADLIRTARVKLNEIAQGLNNTPQPEGSNKISHKAYATELSKILIDSNVALKIQAYILENRVVPNNDIIEKFVKDEAKKVSRFGAVLNPDELDNAWTEYQARRAARDAAAAAAAGEVSDLSAPIIPGGPPPLPVSPPASPRRGGKTRKTRRRTSRR